jgi:hypothetical protein
LIWSNAYADGHWIGPPWVEIHPHLQAISCRRSSDSKDQQIGASDYSHNQPHRLIIGVSDGSVKWKAGVDAVGDFKPQEYLVDEKWKSSRGCGSIWQDGEAAAGIETTLDLRSLVDPAICRESAADFMI